VLGALALLAFSVFSRAHRQMDAGPTIIP